MTPTIRHVSAVLGLPKRIKNHRVLLPLPGRHEGRRGKLESGRHARRVVVLRIGEARCQTAVVAWDTSHDVSATAAVVGSARARRCRAPSDVRRASAVVRVASDGGGGAAAVVEVARRDHGGVGAVIVRTVDVVSHAEGVGATRGHVVKPALACIERARAVGGSPAAVVFRVAAVVGHEDQVGRRARDDLPRASPVVRRALAVVGGAFAGVGRALGCVSAESAVVGDGRPFRGSATEVGWDPDTIARSLPIHTSRQSKESDKARSGV